ncbi:hypothetical protein [Janthinobacterium lividum]|uniref:hypothetical protein n=2 Tax=Janthinobacterium TaxID=29580 RepID=UPI00126A0EB4|nr:hypothetical protein [Janthinobacterium lividum]QKY09185.1 hypothetical protein G8765_16455 [Janthinobacterium lividum]
MQQQSRRRLPGDRTGIATSGGRFVRSDSYSTSIEGEEGRDMANFDANSLRILEQIEDEFRNQYWIIRNSRRTNWRAVNRTRMLGDFMYTTLALNLTALANAAKSIHVAIL